MSRHYDDSECADWIGGFGRGPAGTPDAAGERLAELLDPAQIDALLADAEAVGIGIDGPDGLITLTLTCWNAELRPVQSPATERRL